MGATVTSFLSSKFIPRTIKELEQTALEMALDILRRAVMIAPKDTRTLINSGRIERLTTAAYRIIFGGQEVPYARRRHYENFKNPQTLRYLQRSGDSVKREHVNRYMRRSNAASRIGSAAMGEV